MNYCVASKADFWKLSPGLFGIGDRIVCQDSGDIWMVRESGNHKEFLLYAPPEHTSFSTGRINKRERKLPHNCPNCGAPINPHKEKCEYCDTYYFNESTKSQEKENLDELMRKWESFPHIPTAEALTSWR